MLSVKRFFSICAVVIITVVAVSMASASVNPCAAGLEKAKKDVEKLQLEFTKLLQSSTFDLAKIQKFFITRYVPALIRYNRVKERYDAWNKKHPRPRVKPEVKFVRIVDDSIRPVMRDVDGEYVSGPPPRFVALELVCGGKVGMIRYRVVKGAEKVAAFVGRDVRMKGRFVRSKKNEGRGTVEVIRVKPVEPPKKEQVKLVTIERGIPYLLDGDKTVSRADNASEKVKVIRLGRIEGKQTSRSVTLSPGQSFSFSVQEAPSTGTWWSYHVSNKRVVRVSTYIEGSVVPVDDGKAKRREMGGSVTRWYNVSAAAPGQTEVVFELAPVYDKKEVFNRIVFSVAVNPGPVTPPVADIFYARTPGGRYRVTRDTAAIVSPYEGRRVMLYGRYSLNRSTGLDYPGVVPVIGVVRALRVEKEPSPPGKLERKVVRVEVRENGDSSPLTYICIEEDDRMMRRYEVTRGAELFTRFFKSDTVGPANDRYLDVEGVWSFPDVWIPEITPVGKVEVESVELLPDYRGDTSRSSGTSGDDLNNPFSGQ